MEIKPNYEGQIKVVFFFKKKVAFAMASKLYDRLLNIYKTGNDKITKAHKKSIKVQNTTETAQKNIFSFSKYCEKMAFSKKIALEYDLSCIINKDYISLPRKYDLIYMIL